MQPSLPHSCLKQSQESPFFRVWYQATRVSPRGIQGKSRCACLVQGITNIQEALRLDEVREFGFNINRQMAVDVAGTGIQQ